MMPNQEVPKFMQFPSKRSWLLSIYTCQSGGLALVSHVAEILSHVHDNLFIATSTHSMHAVHPLCILCLMPFVVKAIRISTSNIETSAWKREKKTTHFCIDPNSVTVFTCADVLINLFMRRTECSHCVN